MSAVDLTGAGNDTVTGNFLGTDATGTYFGGENADGVEIENAGHNTIGGTAAAARNVISGNDMGIEIIGGSTGNLIAGNYIGTDKSGSSALGNDRRHPPLNGGTCARRSAARPRAPATSSRAIHNGASSCRTLTASVPTTRSSRGITSAPTRPAKPRSATLPMD